jgi:hypothetical protein
VRIPLGDRARQPLTPTAASKTWRAADAHEESHLDLEATMELNARVVTREPEAPLVVADWKIDAAVVAARCRQHLGDGAAVRLVVPAWLHGLDWAGDPFASVPCAERQTELLYRLCTAAGLDVISAETGDPDPLSAITDALFGRSVTRILLFAEGRHVSAIHPFGLTRRTERLTGLAVHAFLTTASRPRRFADGHCDGSIRPVPTLM